MARKPEPQPARTVEQIEAEIAQLMREHAEIAERIRPLIVEGADTAPLRSDLRSLDQKIAEAHQKMGELIDAHDAKLAEDKKRDISAAVARITASINAKLAGLQPPAKPVKETME